MRRITAVGVALAALLWVGVNASPQAAFAATCGPAWTAVSGVTAKNVNGMDAISSNDVWGVGADFGSPETLFTEHWDGSTWTSINAPESGTADQVFNDVSAVSSNDVWAVGYLSPSDVTETAAWVTLTEHWDGTKWSIIPSPNAPGTSNSLVDVAAISANNVWAVGYTKQTTTRTTLIEHWNGTQWSIVSSPSPSNLTNGLLGISAISANDIWAVGYKGDGQNYSNLFEHYNGTSWSVEPSSGPGVMNDVTAISSSNVWAVGYSGSSADLKSRIMHWNGSSWSASSSPASAAGADVFLALAPVSGNDIWAVGFSYDAALNNSVSFSQHWDGTSWSNINTPQGGGNESELIGATAAPDTGQVWAAGRSGKFGLMLTVCGSPTPQTVTPEALPMFDNGAPDTTTAPGPATTTATTVKATDKASAAGIAELTKTRGAVVFDFNKDGWPDIFLGRHQNAARLYQNNHDGTFTEVDTGTFPKHDRHDCDTADVNNDGKPDLFCAVGANKGTQIKEDELWIQGANHTFTDETGAYGVADVFGRGRDVHFIDVNGDAYPDLFIGNLPDRPDGIPSPSRLYINVNGTHFVDGNTYGLDLEVGESCVQDYDYNNDGKDDLLICSASGMRLYKNTGTGFTDVASTVGLNRNTTETVFADVNNDGHLDSIEVSKKSLKVATQTSGTFNVVFSSALDYGLGVAVGDVNGDGKTDIYVLQKGSGTTNLPDRVYTNDGNGTSFTQLSGIPSASTGNAEDVQPIDYNRDGLTDFVVLNGNGQAQGPINLITFTPA